MHFRSKTENKYSYYSQGSRNPKNNFLFEKILKLKMAAEDGKMRITDITDTEQLFRLIQSIPSPKAEPFKRRLAKSGRERIDEIEDPEIGFDRVMVTYPKKGYSFSSFLAIPTLPFTQSALTI